MDTIQKIKCSVNNQEVYIYTILLELIKEENNTKRAILVKMLSECLEELGVFESKI